MKCIDKAEKCFSKVVFRHGPLIRKEIPQPALGLINVPFSRNRTLAVISFLSAFCPV
jgi:hypothetical protein